MKVSLHIVEARRAQLASMLASEGYLPLADVCSRLGVSEATARRDLSVLAGENAITRTHGGALVEYNQRFPSFRERLANADDAKRRIAAAARRLIKGGMTIWCDGGTTVYRLAEQLADDPVSGLVVVTNSLPVAEMLADREDCEVHLLGGRFFRRSSLLIGGHAAENVAAWHFDLAFLGAEGLDAKGAWNSQADMTALQRLVVERSGNTVLLADASKLGCRAPEFLAGWSTFDRVLTDAKPGQLKTHGITLAPGRLIAA